MASVLDRYGIKEVADVTFYKLDKDGLPAYPVLYLDTLKVSTIEQTADEATANGGKGNVALISWDYNKDINVTLEDALFSAKSMAIMFGNGDVVDYTTTEDGAAKLIMKTEQFSTNDASEVTIAGAASTALKAIGWNPYFEGPDGKSYEKLNAKFFDEQGNAVATLKPRTKYFCSFDLAVSGSVIKIDANSFPGTYYVVGDTWVRPQAGGDDEFFQFIIPKAKVLSENTITLEADGDPSVFSMNLHVLRPESGDMMKLVKYDLYGGTKIAGAVDAEIQHNHVLNKSSGTSALKGSDVARGTTGANADAARPANAAANAFNISGSDVPGTGSEIVG